MECTIRAQMENTLIPSVAELANYFQIATGSKWGVGDGLSTSGDAQDSHQFEPQESKNAVNYFLTLTQKPHTSHKITFRGRARGKVNEVIIFLAGIGISVQKRCCLSGAGCGILGKGFT